MALQETLYPKLKKAGKGYEFYNEKKFQLRKAVPADCLCFNLFRIDKLD